MKLIKKLGTRENQHGTLVSWGLYFCSYCKKEVEKPLKYTNEKYKSCGCVRRKLQAENRRARKLYLLRKKDKFPKENEEKILEQYRLLALKMAHKYNYHDEFDHVLAEANIGIIKGFRTYRKEKGGRLLLYLRFGIRTQLHSVYYKQRIDTISLEYRDGNEYDPVDESENLFDNMVSKELSKKLCHILTTLSKDEKDIICRRFGLGGYEQHSLGEVGTAYGVSRESIRKIEIGAIKKLKNKGSYLKEFLYE